MPYQFFVASSGGTQERALEAHDVRTFRLNIRTKSELSPKVYWAIKPLIHLIKQNRIDLIHAHTRITQVLAWWVQRLAGIPYVSTCHGFYKTRVGRRILPAWGDHVIAISKPVENSLMHDFHVPPDRVSTIFNAIDIDDLSRRYKEKNPLKMRQKLNIREDSPVIGIVARIVQDKGHEYFLQAAKRLILSTHPNIKILVVGEGPYLKPLKHLAGELGLNDSVLFMGNLEDVTEALAIIDVFVLPAIWREGFGLSIIEAMAVRIPVVVTNIWSLNELVQNRINGLLVEPKNVEDLENAIRELLCNQELYEVVSRRGAETVSHEFSIPKMAEGIHALYSRILSEAAAKADVTAENIST